jgi:hypothetical protein
MWYNGFPMMRKVWRYREDEHYNDWSSYWDTKLVSHSSGNIACGVGSYLRRNTHLHVGLELMAPPAIGPTRSDNAYTELRYAEYSASFSGGTKSVIIAVERAKHPAPPIPWNARSAVLVVVRYIQHEFDTTVGTYSCTKVCDAPHAAEKAMKIRRESDTITLLPKMSLSFAKTTRTPESGQSVLLAKSFRWCRDGIY